MIDGWKEFIVLIILLALIFGVHGELVIEDVPDFIKVANDVLYNIIRGVLNALGIGI